MSTKQISIQGVPVTVSAPYVAGHVLTENEAKALNQVRAENIGNNFRKAISAAKEGKEGAKPIEVILEELAAYDANYQFSARVAGVSRATRTPLEKEADRLAKQWLVGRLKEQGKTLKAYTEEKGEEFVADKLDEIANTEAIQAQAKKNLAAALKNADAVGVAV